MVICVRRNNCTEVSACQIQTVINNTLETGKAILLDTVKSKSLVKQFIVAILLILFYIIISITIIITIYYFYFVQRK